jgi:16S rRNA (uracil1498-N3)-methyltransferase
MSERTPLHRFYVDASLDPDRTIDLPEHIANQVRKVLRLRIGDQLVLFDGHGHEAVARIATINPRGVSVEVVTSPVPGRIAGSPKIILGIALLKSDRLDLVIQKATELGVSRIIPLESERCVVSLPADRARSRVQRWRRIAIEALEQSGRSDQVDVESPEQLTNVVGTLQADRRLIAWEHEPNRSITSQIDGTEESVAVLIGPEGGFTESEIAAAVDSGFVTVSLGTLTLRSETAAIAAMAMVRTAADIHRADAVQANEN